jgi:hypothetical protein
MNMKTNNQSGITDEIRHAKALDLGFIHIKDNFYKVPENWNSPNTQVDLSATGNEEWQIMRSVAQQLARRLGTDELVEAGIF